MGNLISTICDYTFSSSFGVTLFDLRNQQSEKTLTTENLFPLSISGESIVPSAELTVYLLHITLFCVSLDVHKGFSTLSTIGMGAKSNTAMMIDFMAT